jgi:predicted benzoate:H+ symporter BenE
MTVEIVVANLNTNIPTLEPTTVAENAVIAQSLQHKQFFIIALPALILLLTAQNTIPFGFLRSGAGWYTLTSSDTHIGINTKS